MRRGPWGSPRRIVWQGAEGRPMRSGPGRDFPLQALAETGGF